MEFGKLTSFDLEVSDEINFQVLDNETNNFEKPIVYNNLSTPITLTYLNKNVKTAFQIRQNETSIIYDGRLLKSANIDLTKLICGVSFTVAIETKDNIEYQCRIYFEIPYKTDAGTILDGNILQTIQTNGTGRFYQF